MRTGKSAAFFGERPENDFHAANKDGKTAEENSVLFEASQSEKYPQQRYGS